MHLPAFDWHPARRHLRQFAWATALFLAVLSWAGGALPWTLSMRLSAACLFAIGTVLPGILRWPYLALLLMLYLVALLLRPILRSLAPNPARRRDSRTVPRPLSKPSHRQSAAGLQG